MQVSIDPDYAPHCIRSKEDLDKLPPGHRFVPKDEELIEFYLQKKISNEPLPYNKIHEANVYNYHPQDLPGEYASNGETNSQWYFFSTRTRKYPKGQRPNRIAKGGYWKPTGVDKTIKKGERIIGHRKSLDFYEGGHTDGNKTDWKMHEFRQEEKDDANSSNNEEIKEFEGCVMYKVYKKEPKKKENKVVVAAAAADDDGNAGGDGNDIEDTGPSATDHSSDREAKPMSDQNQQLGLVYDQNQFNNSDTNAFACDQVSNNYGFHMRYDSQTDLSSDQNQLEPMDHLYNNNFGSSTLDDNAHAVQCFYLNDFNAEFDRTRTTIVTDVPELESASLEPYPTRKDITKMENCAGPSAQSNSVNPTMRARGYHHSFISSGNNNLQDDHEVFSSLDPILPDYRF